ncbi:hypothetical protein CDV55_108290 [Aspergillus turcosus]|nr:hypothetical protein CDV55_108290 [Aspergillus turcosus]
MHFTSPKDLDSSDLNPSSPKLIFMRGLPSPEWLLSIGVKFQVDPEFFQRHLGFYEELLPHEHHFVNPSLPSANKCIARLRVTTVGYSKIDNTKDPQQMVESLQRENAEKMNTYRQRVKSRLHYMTGDSVFREFSIHDLEHFTIEQDITISISQNREGWTVLIWLDIGDSPGLPRGFESPLNLESLTTTYLPVVQYIPGIALDNWGQQSSVHYESENNATHLVQNVSWLHLNYGQSLNRNLIAKSPFYALHEIFSFVASSENQFLNMLESKIRKELDAQTLVGQKNPTLSHLLYNQQVLDRHIQRLRENLTFIRRFTPASPHHESEQDDEAAISAEEILRDYEYLLSGATTLSEQCNRGMQVVMNNANIKESRKAISQAEGVEILTRLAFIFIPLNFVTSVFGMNFVQFGQGELSLWIWPAVSIPVFLLSVILMRSNVIEFFKGLYRPLTDQRN